MKLRLIFDPEKCCACHACAVACMDQNDVDVASGQEPRRRVAVIESLSDGSLACASISCVHCLDAPCVSACASGCLYKDADTGLTLYDAEKCVGCRSCAEACPVGAVCFGPDGRINKCDGCVTRRQNGMEPACVRVCPTGALKT